MIDEAGPIWNSRVISGRYAMLGRICMKSSTGVTIPLNRADIPAQIPSASPKVTESATAARVSANVLTLSSQTPRTPRLKKPRTARIAIFQLAKISAIAPKTAVTPSQPMLVSAFSTHG